MTPTTQEPWVDARAVAAHIGFTAEHVRNQAKKGLLPCHESKNGRRRFFRFKLSQVDAAMQAQAAAAIRKAMPMMSAIVDIGAKS